MSPRGLIIDLAIVAGLALFFSAVWEWNPLVARASGGLTLFSLGVFALWRRMQ